MLTSREDMQKIEKKLHILVPLWDFLCVLCKRAPALFFFHFELGSPKNVVSLVLRRNM